ncbi:MAG: hypothetical protein MI865_08005 [Proteobacteria bacterium]|nr:hypothetical protein [Pseudomonadota bacterium]
MKPIVSILALLIPLVLSFNISAGERGATTLDRGLDGTIRYYDVICPSEKRTALSYDFQTRETCVTPVSGDGTEVCKVNWDKDQAAKDACK